MVHNFCCWKDGIRLELVLAEFTFEIREIWRTCQILIVLTWCFRPSYIVRGRVMVMWHSGSFPPPPHYEHRSRRWGFVWNWIRLQRYLIAAWLYSGPRYISWVVVRRGKIIRLPSFRARRKECSTWMIFSWTYAFLLTLILSHYLSSSA